MTPPSLKLAPIFPRRTQLFSRSRALLRSFFPSTHQRARTRLDSFRNLIPNFKHRAQSRIYRYLVTRQAKRQHKRKTAGVLARLASRGRFLWRDRRGRNAGANMTSEGTWQATLRDAQNAMGGGSYGRETGSRRKKLAGYLKAANELRQTYQSSWNTRDGTSDMPGAYPEGSMGRSGEEEMLLFPSYARRHVKEKVSVL